jgi:hypothetical protein
LLFEPPPATIQNQRGAPAAKCVGFCSHTFSLSVLTSLMPPKTPESAVPPPLDDLEAELKLKHSRKAAAAGAACDDGNSAAAAAHAANAAAGCSAGSEEDGSSAVAQALAASGRLSSRLSLP